MSLTTIVYQLTALLPEKERYGLVSQIQRSAVSIPSNIAEGSGRNSNKEFIQFLSIALGSSFELHTQLTICENLKYLESKELKKHFQELDEIQKMIVGFIKNLKSKI